MAPRQNVRRKIGEAIRDQLLDQIRNGQLRPGDRLPGERQLMQQFGVGRPAIREAMQSLASAGLIQIHQGERTRVASPDARHLFDNLGQTMLHLLHSSPATLHDLRIARLDFELGMARQAAQRATRKDIATLRALLDNQRAAAEAVDSAPDQFVRADMAFHAAITAICGNSVYTLLSNAMLDWLFHFRQEVIRVPGSEQVTMQEHEAVVAAIAAKDPAAAEAAMAHHLNQAAQRYGYPNPDQPAAKRRTARQRKKPTESSHAAS